MPMHLSARARRGEEFDGSGGWDDEASWGEVWSVLMRTDVLGNLLELKPQTRHAGVRWSTSLRNEVY